MHPSCDHPQLRGMSRTLTLFLQFPIVTTILWGAASWQNHDSFPPQSVIILHSNVCLGLSNPYVSSALWRQRKSKNTAHYIPMLLRGLGEAVATNGLCIIIPPANFVCRGYTVFTLSVRASVRPSVRPCVRPSVTLCFLNNSKSHCWIFIKPCKHVHICKTNTLDKKVRARGQFY